MWLKLEAQLQSEYGVAELLIGTSLETAMPVFEMASEDVTFWNARVM